ncbi:MULTISPECIES: YodL domain-containing protein [Sutcliffiella]|uniref:YodL-like protein n=1 Tax=Sutcliffiella cohnii TaxID=33932 RepID=A0A223KQJ0_9BACI|nr:MULTISPECIES: YodL domain-containing protein [Sutcliffiella]AST91770.1 hypothetical protein BC6307_11010 [Sutcliffiella cohnii]MED4018570.1 YodL domain-containing protein [Sutcliffiella cohnii]WBL12988.1 YodL domain-containing protein [Sutcliffiella sp. NC1]
MLKKWSLYKKDIGKYDVTILQTPNIGENKGYVPIYRVNIEGRTHTEVIQTVFSTFNVRERIPHNYRGRFISTGDIVLIDEGFKGKTYYRLSTNGWKELNRVMIM